MAEKELNIKVKLESAEKAKIAELREQQRSITKDIKRLQGSLRNADKLDDWKMLHELKQEIVGRLAKVNVSWKKFIATPDYFEYAWYVSSGKPGAPRRIKTSMTKPPTSETRTDEATMIRTATEQRSKVVRRKTRKKRIKVSFSSHISSGKAKAIGSIGVG